MKSLDLSKLGGFPFAEDDLEYAIVGLTERINALLSPYAAGGIVILAGCEVSVSGPNTTINAGYMCIGTNVYYVQSYTFVTAAITTLKWVLVQGFNPAGNLTFENLAIEQVYISDEMTIQNTTGPGVLFDYATQNWTYIMGNILQYAPQLAPASALVTLASNSIDTWHVVGAVSEPAYGGTWLGATGQDSRFKKDDVEGVAVRLALKCSGSPPLTVFNLPAGYRPATKIVVVIHKYVISTAPTPYFLTIQTNGDVQISDPSGGSVPAADYFGEYYFKI